MKLKLPMVLGVCNNTVYVHYLLCIWAYISVCVCECMYVCMYAIPGISVVY